MALYFDEPEDVTIRNATIEYVHSIDFESVQDMVKAVDKKVTETKKEFGRRREDYE